MKQVMLMLSFTIGVFATSCAQQKQAAPAAVQTAFKTKFPAVQKAKWDMEEADQWEAEFKMNGRKMSANFTAGGTWMETETEMKTADLPQAVKEAIAVQFAGYKMEEASMLETPEWTAAYEVELEKGETTIEAVFGADGTLLRQTTEEEDEDRE